MSIVYKSRAYFINQVYSLQISVIVYKLSLRAIYMHHCNININTLNHAVTLVTVRTFSPTEQLIIGTSYLLTLLMPILLKMN